jgi:sugar/nucleoside kinase (ribokinase family)
MLAGLIHSPSLSDLTGEAIRSILTYAAAAGALTTQKVGVIPALPTAEEVEMFLAR